MKKILAFSGSMSSNSINHKLVEYAATLITEQEVKIIRLSDYAAPIYAKETEDEEGIPDQIKRLRKEFDSADVFIISTPEYNGSIPGGFKNTLDWISRTEGKIFQDKPVLLMSTSPGGRGGKSVLDHLSAIIPFWGGKLVGPFSLPLFGQHFIDGKMDVSLNAKLTELTKELEV